MRFIGLFIAIPFIIHHARTNQQRNAPATPVSYGVAMPSGYYSDTAVAGSPHLASLQSFEAQIGDSSMTDSGRDLWRQQIAGQRVQWVGYVFTPRDAIGGPAIASDMDPSTPVIHLQTATKSAKTGLRRIPEGTRVKIDGVLMDEHWLHVIDVSPAW